MLFSTVIIPIVNANLNTENSLIKRQNKTFLSKDNRGPILDRIIEFLKKIPFINRTINFIKNIFGLVEDTPDLVGPDGGYYEPYYQDGGTEPGSEGPMDTSISVSIKSYDLKYTNDDNNFEFDMTFSGSTSGDVYACYWILVNYFDDGTNAYARIWMCPIQTELDLSGYSFESTFMGTGPGGDDDWSTFKARQYANGVSVDQDKIPFDIPDSNQDKSLRDVRLFVRAFSDKELTMWNQDSISLFDELSDTIYKDQKEDETGSEDKGIPGFEILLVIVAICVALILLKKKKS